MRVVVVSSLTPIATANYLVQAMRRAGDTLFTISDVPSPNADVTAYASPDVATLCHDRGFEPDLALFIEGGTHGTVIEYPEEVNGAVVGFLKRAEQPKRRSSGGGAGPRKATSKRRTAAARR